MKKCFFFLFISSFAFSQNLNQYKYALVPAKFSFLNDKNQYNLNVISKLYMEKYGFETYIDDNLKDAPQDFVNNNCNKIYVDLINNSSMFSTKVKIVLKDCKGTVLYTSAEGTSREKEYYTAYNQSIREAFDAMATLNHRYDNSKDKVEVPQQNQSKNETNIETKAKSETLNLALQPLFAKPFGDYGFQFFTNNTNVPQCVMTVFKTSNPNLYIAQKNDKNGVLINNLGSWTFEYYEKNQLISEKIAVKF